MTRHLQLVPPPPPVNEEYEHHVALRDAGTYILKRGGSRLVLTVTDVDGLEVHGDPASTTHREFAVRASTTFPGRNPNRIGVAWRSNNPFSTSNVPPNEYAVLGISDPVPRHQFLGDPAVRRSAEAEALLDLMQQIRPHRGGR